MITSPVLVFSRETNNNGKPVVQTSSLVFLPFSVASNFLLTLYSIPSAFSFSPFSSMFLDTSYFHLPILFLLPCNSPHSSCLPGFQLCPDYLTQNSVPGWAHLFSVLPSCPLYADCSPGSSFRSALFPELQLHSFNCWLESCSSNSLI